MMPGDLPRPSRLPARGRRRAARPAPARPPPPAGRAPGPGRRRVRARGQPGLRTHRRDQRQPQRRDDLVRAMPPGAGPRTTSRRTPPCSATTAATRAAAAQERTSAGTTRTVRSAAAERRDRGIGGVARQVADHRLARPATGIRTAATAAGEGPCGDRSHDSTRQPARDRPTRRRQRGVQGARGHPPARPCRAPASAGRPRSSAPSTRSSPPPRGSQSTSSTRLPVARRAHRRRRREHRRTRAAPAADDGEHRAVAASALGGLASAATSQGSASGREITCSAPTATACFHASGGGSPDAATTTPGRRGSPPSAHAPRGRTRRAPRPAQPASSGGPRWDRPRARARIRPPRPSAARRPAVRVGHHHETTPALGGPAASCACSPRCRPFICAHPRPVARAGRMSRWGRGCLWSDDLVRCGWSESDVDNSVVPAEGAAVPSRWWCTVLRGGGNRTAPVRGDWRGPPVVQLRGVELNLTRAKPGSQL